MGAGLVERGAILIDADEIVRDLQQPGEPVFNAIVGRWGQAVVAGDGTLDRAAVAAVVFNDSDELAALNSIVHPAVGEEMARRRAAAAEQSPGAVVVLDIPLLVRPEASPSPSATAAWPGSWWWMPTPTWRCSAS